MATADTVAPPPGFVDDLAPPEGFVEDVAPPPGFELDQSRGVTATSEAHPPASAGSTPAPASNRIVDAARRVGSGIAEAATTAAAGLTRISEVATGSGLGSMLLGLPSPGEPVRELLGEVQRRSRAAYGVDPDRDKEIVSKVIQGATSLVPIIASGPAAPVTAAGLMGESTRQDAEAHGATEGQKAAAFAGGATLGVVSEALLGIPALLRSAKAAGATDAVLKSISRQAVEQGLKNTVRESSQEMIEQVSGNLLANTIVGYDPSRETSAGVLEAGAIGAAIGGPVGALVQTAATLDARTDASFEQLKQEAESVAAPPTTTTDAISKPEAVQPNENVLAPEGAPEGAGQVPAAERRLGVPARGQGTPVRAEGALKKEGKLKPGFVRLWRGGTAGKEGAWFSDSKEVAEFHYQNHAFDNRATLSYVDVPASEAIKYQDAAFAHPDVVSGKTIAEGGDHVLPQELLDKAVFVRARGKAPAEAPSAAVEPLPNPTKSALLDRMKEPGVDYATEPNSIVIQLRGLDTYPIGTGKPIVLPFDGNLAHAGAVIDSGMSKTVGASNASFRESLIVVTDANGRATHYLTYNPAERTVQAATREDIVALRSGNRPVPKPAPDVAPHLKTDKAVQSILDEQPAAPEAPTMKAPEVPAEGGAAGGTGGRRPPPPTAIGETPRGDRNWLRIPAWFRRIGRGLFTEGARHVLGRTRNQVGIALGRATRRHVDVEQELFGQHERILRDALRGIPNNRQEALWTEVSQHVRDVENGRPAPPLAPDAQRVLDAWYDVGRSTGDIARANNVMVWDANIGAYRPMGTVTNYIPRMFSREVESALRDPERNPALFNSLAQAIATHRGIPLPDAAAELNRVAGRFSANDFHGNLELARLEQLPEIFYEYDLRNLASRYLPAFSERMAQIIAYGQRLGPREQPQRMNLWDIARRESRDETTQQWLNAAEDQATGFRPKNEFERNARRLQAIGNATLLSDPTTTVVRNLISGLSVTAERFGVVRSLRALREASRAASGLDAREIGALRDDIGSFLGAEQLGDSALDNLIRSGQQTALTAAGFSGSENFVRRHGAMTASAFARDAANALSTSPTSGLAKEALRYFRSLDIDPELIVAEGGNWRTGPETRRFIRSSVRESQGGYRFDQVPIWGGSTVGRFLYQYGRWGIQRAGDIFRNTIRPAIGETVEFRGQRMTRRNVMPLLRLGMLTVGLGETFAAIAAMLFGRDRRDASLSEIGEAFSEDEARAVGLMGERIINDVLMAGTLGLIGQPVDYFKALKDQTRLKNPLDPPSIAGVKTLTELATKAKDQGGTLTKRDLLDAASGLARGPKNVTDVARNVADEKLYEAQNDQRTLRNAARRWAKTQGMDVASKIGFDTVRKSLNAPVFEAINDALLTGNPDKAKQLRDEFVNSKKTSAEKKKAREAVHSSVEGRHPFRAGPFTADKYRKQFTTWAEKNLPEQDREQIRRVIETYDKASREAGL